MSTTYTHTEIEQKWYKNWINSNVFSSQPNTKEPYTVLMPPPNVTGILHMGHVLNNTIQDVLVRRARMLGKNSCWIPGTDHASIATEAKVVQRLKAQGKTKWDIGREDFLKECWKWTKEHGGIIIEQLKTLGVSCDWDRLCFTLDKGYSDDVLYTFKKLYDKGYIYRGQRMINWDVEAQTTISDEEVMFKETHSTLFYLKYIIENSNDYLTIATTRPETIFADIAVCVHPKDERFASLIGKYLIVPISGQSIPVIADEYVDADFGTGCLKITPAHDKNDLLIFNRHKDILHTFDSCIDKYGKILCPKHTTYHTKDRFEVRKAIVSDLKHNGFLEKEEQYKNTVGYSERTNTIVESRVSVQWFCAMKDVSKQALEYVENDDIHFHPQTLKNTYTHWMYNIQDWCISRQLWWGHRIPAYYYGTGINDFVIALNKEDALKQAQDILKDNSLTINDLKQDEDVLDTWFSSWLWPISVFDGIQKPNNADITYYYPSNDLVTAPEIIFFWVARMIMCGSIYKQDKPFSNVYFTGIVRDEKRRKMSKSLGNSPDPIQMIKEYSADGVRAGILFCSPAGNDLLFKKELCLQGRNFSNKIWNAFLLISNWKTSNTPQKHIEKDSINWFEHKFNLELEHINLAFNTFKLSKALMLIYKLIWDDFCAYFLECIKPKFGDNISKETQVQTVEIFKKLMQILHPFMPFITEEIFQKIDTSNTYINQSSWPKQKAYNTESITQMGFAFELISHIRNHKIQQNIPQKTPIEMITQNTKHIPYSEIVQKLGGVEHILTKKHSNQDYALYIINTIEYHLPIAKKTKEDIQDIEKEIQRLKNFLAGINRKLDNPKFLNNAPKHVLDTERKKQSDTLHKIQLLEKHINTESI